MAEAIRDDNRVPVKMGTYNGTPTLLKVEHATGYLKAVIVPTTLSVPSISPSVAPRDDNHVTAIMGTYNGSAKPVMCDHATGYIKAVIQ